jgi:glyoxylase-like metal-dependent hydrolase (beta-lactamase superfamily II)
VPNVQRISLHYNNVYVVDGGGVRILIDTGPDYQGAWAAIQRALDGHLPDLVVTTHGHLDHAGLGRRWQQSGILVAIHSNDVHLATATQLQSPEDFNAMADYARGTGAPADVTDAAVASLEDRKRWAYAAATGSEHPPAGRNGRWPTGLRYRTFSPDRDVSSLGELLGMAGLEVHHMPGHTPGNVVVVCPAEGWLFSGDQLLPEFTPTPAIQFIDGHNAPQRFRSLPEFVASMKRIDGAALLKCLPGHGEPFEDVHAAITRNLEAIDERTVRVLAALRKSGGATVFELCEAIYPRAARRRYWQVVATIQGNLDAAEAAGAVNFNGTLYEWSG